MKRYFSFLKPFDIFMIALGCAIYGVSANLFIIPNKIAPGGATGLATVIHYIFNVPVGTMIIFINLPLFWFSHKILGKAFLLKTMLATLLLSFFVDLFSLLPAYRESLLLAGIMGGVLNGIGLGLVFGRGVMTGGSDLLAHLLRSKFPHITLGQFILIIDVVVITIATIAFRNITNAFYAAISIYISTKVIDTVLNGFSTAKSVLIISSEPDVIVEGIIKELHRTATILEGRGAFTDQKQEVLLCVVRRHEFFKLKIIVKNSDKKAFIIVFDAGEVLGLGFNENFTD